jgi:hypothetical protein
MKHKSQKEIPHMQWEILDKERKGHVLEKYKLQVTLSII